MRLGFSPALHSLRAVAALSVLLFHWTQMFPGFNRWLASFHVPGHPWFNPTLPFALGWQGVSLFFVLSGYLLTRQWIDRPLTKHHILRFYMRRCLRIYPAVWLQIFLLLILAWLVPNVWHMPSGMDFWLNVLLWINLPPTHTLPLTDVMWTLPVELLFYAALPLLVWARRRYGLVLLGVLLVAVTLGWRMFFVWAFAGKDLSGSMQLYVLDALPGVLSTFGVGLLAAYLQPRVQPRHCWPMLLGALVCNLLLQTVLVDNIETYWSGGALLIVWGTLLAVTLAVLVLVVVKAQRLLTSGLLLQRWLVRLGDWSFGIYLWHYPLMQIYRTVYESSVNSFWGSLLALILVLFGTLVMSAISFYAVERRFMNLGRR